RKFASLIETRLDGDVSVQVQVAELAIAADGDHAIGDARAFEDDGLLLNEAAGGIDEPVDAVGLDARASFGERKRERVRPQDEIARAIVEARLATGFFLAEQETAGAIGSREVAERGLSHPSAGGIDDADGMLGQTGVDDGDAAAKTLCGAI